MLDSLCTEYQPEGRDPVSASAVAIKNGQVFTPSGKAFPFPVPRALELHEIPRIVRKYAEGARNSLRAGKPDLHPTFFHFVCDTRRTVTGSLLPLLGVEGTG